MDSSKKPEKANPRAKASIFSQLFFAWTVPVLFQAAEKGLSTEDLTLCLDKDKSEKLGDKLEESWERECQQAAQEHRKPSLKKAIIRLYFSLCIPDGFLIFLFVLIKSLLPVVLAQFLLQFQRSPTTEFLVGLSSDDENVNRSRRAITQNATGNLLNPPAEVAFDDPIIPMSTQSQWTSAVWNDVYCLAAGIVSLTFLACLFCHHADLRLRMLGARLRISCCSLIFRKTVRISKKAAGKTSTGYLVNLLSNDVSRLDFVFQFMHYVWILPFQSILIGYLIWRQVGWASLVGVLGLLLKTIPVQTGLSRLSSYVRERVAKRTDHRVGIMNELIQGIKLIKTYAWEIPFQAIVAEARRREVKFVRYASYVRGILLSTMVFIERSTLFITIAACVYLGYPITADVVFSMAQFFNILQLTAAIFYPLALSLWAESNVSVSRIGDYLQFEEQDEVVPGLEHKENAKDADLAIEFDQLAATWEDEKNKTLDKITFSVKPGQLCAIIGPVGSGKSSLLQLLLGEMPIHTGTATINGSLSYAAQEPWLFTGTVRHNILFGQAYDRRRYQDVVRHCALLTDFEQLPNGDQTMVGERGAALSGGQKARISLARCVYRQASIYLLDDPLSAVDAHVGRHLFDEVIGLNGCLALHKSTRLLVTHQVHYLKSADWIVIIENGQISRQGTYTDLSNSKLDFAKLLQKDEKSPEKLLKSSLVSLHEDSDADEDIPFIDGYVGVKTRTSSQSSSNKLNSNDFDDNEREEKEDQAEGSVPFSVWKRYFFAGSNCCGLIILLFVLILSQVITSGSDYFVNFWTQQEFLRGLDQETIFTREECLLIYGLFILAVIFMTTIRGWMFFNLCMRASKQLHNKMFASILHASMIFFDANPSGRILNRFSRDMGSIDEMLPKAMMDSIQIGLVMIGILSMVSIVNPFLLVALAIAVCLFSLVLKLYLPASQDLKRLEGICRSPIFSYVSASLSGLSTIRAARIQNRISSEFDSLQDVHSGIWQVTYSTNTALGLWLDCISTAFVAAVTFSFLALHETFSGNVGLAVSQALILTGMVQYGIRQTTESLQQMTSVERILHYTDLPAEKSPSVKAPEKWPTAGVIEFNRMSLMYNQFEGAVLKNLNLHIEAGWKVGIVGRTGAGKSSLISALFRLYDIEGVIRIDGIDTASISLEQLRSSISIIPQDPVLFSATIRYNLDPFHLFNDAEIYRVLEEVELKHVAENLDYMVLEGGVNFSVGQRQLICLARAILRNNKVLVLDEATANVDPQTDALIQKTIRDKFRHCTVLTIAHRLITVMDSDRIIVMESGEAKEYGVPYLLLQNDSGLLRDMVNATGPIESEALNKIAADTYNNSQLEKTK
ncbi:multidrug resistance-associated protein 4 [Sergentomyia squamirostris]